MTEKLNNYASLLQFVGEDKVRHQIVSECMEGAVEFDHEDGYTTFTMYTDIQHLPPKSFFDKSVPQKVGLLIWIDPEDFARWQASKKEAKND